MSSSGWQPISTIPKDKYVLVLLVPRNKLYQYMYNWITLDKFNGEVFNDMADFLINNNNKETGPAMAVAWKHISRNLPRKRVNQLVGDNRDVGRHTPPEPEIYVDENGNVYKNGLLQLPDAAGMFNP